uniref:Cytochrome P450 2B4-like n=1 Tax=Bos indicus x Bos taurus TaxID=30522 RepID=A0A4W2E3R4_BOBOX
MDQKGLLKSFQALREKYGDVFTIYLGSRPAVILWWYEAMKEALVDQAEAFSGRGHIAIIDPVFQGTGVVFANGKSWKVLRRFSVTTMKDFGMGKQSIEERIKEEAQCLVEELQKSQEKVQAEIDRVIGAHCLPTLEDRAKMPYTDAVIHEIQRFSDLVPVGVPHSVIKDTHFRGYYLPKRFYKYTEVFFLFSALQDPRHFEKPNTFYPGHFLDAQGNFRKPEVFIPFSMGKRLCLGESLARSELFLFLTTLLQNFSLGSPKAPEDIDLTPRENGLGRPPTLFQVRFLPRR